MTEVTAEKPPLRDTWTGGSFASDVDSVYLAALGIGSRLCVMIRRPRVSVIDDQRDLTGSYG